MRLVLLSFLCFALTALSALQVGGLINQSQLWSEDVTVTSNVTVSSSAVISINPGVNVVFTGAFFIEFHSYARLLVNGTADSPVRFTADWDGDSVYGEEGANPEYWKGVRFQYMNGLADSSRVNYCIFEHAYKNNVGGEDDKYGAALYIDRFDHIRFNHCEFNNNEVYGSTVAYGGAVYLDAASPEFYNCQFLGNQANVGTSFRGSGGAMYMYQANPFIINSRFTQNYAEDQGGAVAGYQGFFSLFFNCIFDNNTSDMGGAFYLYDTDPIISNCTITQNSATYGGGINSDLSTPYIGNSVIYGNTTTFRGAQLYNNSSSPELNSCLVEGGDAAFYNNGICNYVYDADCLESDPLFDNSDINKPFFPGDGSPCIDNGVSQWYSQLYQLDYLGNPRVSNNTIDIGVYEIRGGLTLQYLSLTFPDTDLGQTSEESLWLYNMTDSDVGINSFSTDSDLFTVSNDEINIPANDSILVHISFSPLEIGTHTANLLIDADTDQLTVSLTGHGMAGILYGNQYIDTIHCLIGETVSFQIFLENAGNQPIVISSYIPSSPAMNVTAPLPITIEPNEFLLLDCEFTPEDMIQRNYTIELTSDAYNENPFTCWINGFGDTIPVPENLAISMNNGEVTLTWDSVVMTYLGFALEGVTYIIEISSTPDFSQLERISTGNNTNQYTPGGTATRSYYRVLAAKN